MFTQLNEANKPGISLLEDVYLKFLNSLALCQREGRVRSRNGSQGYMAVCFREGSHRLRLFVDTGLSTGSPALAVEVSQSQGETEGFLWICLHRVEFLAFPCLWMFVERRLTQM